MNEDRVIIIPTDTVYGLATRVYDEIGLERIYEIKKRKNDKPIAVLCSNIDMVKKLGVVSSKAEKIILALMPGALTIILRATLEYSKKTKEETVGIRIPNNELALSIISKMGPLKTTSVNTSDEEPINDINEIKSKYLKYVDKIYEDNEEKSKVSSTVVSFIDDEIKIIREGQIKKEDIIKIINI